MADETRRALVKAGMAGAVAMLGPGAGRVLRGDGEREGCHGRDAADGRASGLRRPSGERLRRGRLRRPGPPPRACCGRWRRSRSTGVTRFLPTLITSSLETFSACARTIARATSLPRSPGSTWRGRTSPPRTARAAPTPAAFVRGADVDDFRRRQEAAEGRIRLVTVAPEAPGALRVIEHAVGRGVRVAIGHTGATRSRSRPRWAPGPRSPPTSATAARRCCPATRT